MRQRTYLILPNPCETAPCIWIPNFDEVQLERYGHSAGPIKQPILSGVHFFGNIFFLPYKMGLNPPTECQYALGYYRPGSCAPWLLPAVPLSARGARWQLAAVIGALAIFP